MLPARESGHDRPHQAPSLILFVLFAVTTGAKTHYLGAAYVYLLAAGAAAVNPAGRRQGSMAGCRGRAGAARCRSTARMRARTTGASSEPGRQRPSGR